MQIDELDDAIPESLRSFYADIADGWCGREREAVSLFAFGHLARHCGPGKLLSLAQVGIEVAVRQLKRDEQHKRRGPTVCKDLVIWPEPAMTLWDAMGKRSHEPLAVMEWKVNYSFGGRAHRKNRLEHDTDVQWLKETSERVTGFVGYAVLLEGALKPKKLTCTRTQQGSLIPDWEALPTAGDKAPTVSDCP
jgi:hypothetical protein